MIYGYDINNEVNCVFIKVAERDRESREYTQDLGYIETAMGLTGFGSKVELRHLITPHYFYF